MAKTYKWLNIEKFRYYTIEVEQDRSSSFILHYRWGGCGTNRGGNKNIIAQNEEEVINHIDKMMKRRKSRGYQLI